MLQLPEQGHYNETKNLLFEDEHIKVGCCLLCSLASTTEVIPNASVPILKESYIGPRSRREASEPREEIRDQDNGESSLTTHSDFFRDRCQPVPQICLSTNI